MTAFHPQTNFGILHRPFLGQNSRRYAPERTSVRRLAGSVPFISEWAEISGLVTGCCLRLLGLSERIAANPAFSSRATITSQLQLARLSASGLDSKDLIVLTVLSDLGGFWWYLGGSCWLSDLFLFVFLVKLKYKHGFA